MQTAIIEPNICVSGEFKGNWRCQNEACGSFNTFKKNEQAGIGSYQCRSCTNEFTIAMTPKNKEIELQYQKKV